MIQLGRFDELGSGVRNINKYLPFYAHGAKPIFKDTIHGFELTLPIADMTGVESGEVTPEVTPEVRKMLKVMQGEMSRKEIQQKLGLTDEKHFREFYQQPAVAVELIALTIPDKPRSSKQKYRLTEKGKMEVRGLNGNHE